MKKADTIFNELDRLHQAISRRAYDLFRSGGTLWGDALTDWFTAERELISKPAVELRQKDNRFAYIWCRETGRRYGKVSHFCQRNDAEARFSMPLTACPGLRRLHIRGMRFAQVGTG